MRDESKIASTRKIYEVLESIRGKPYFWLTSKSVTALQDFLNGYMQLGYADEIYYPDEPDVNDFKYWLLNRDAEHSGVGNPYSRVLLKECNGDEEKAFDRFFQLLDEFKREQKSLR
jgi:hypothetical protein